MDGKAPNSNKVPQCETLFRSLRFILDLEMQRRYKLNCEINLIHLQETEYLALYHKGLLSSTCFHSHTAHENWSKGSGTMDMNVLKTLQRRCHASRMFR